MKKTNETISDDKNRTLKVTNVRRTSVGPLPDIRIYRHRRREHNWACNEYPKSPSSCHNDASSSPVYQRAEIQNSPEHHLTDLFSNMSDVQNKKTSSKNIQAYIADSKSDLKELIKVLGDRIKHFEDKFDKTTELTHPTKYLRSKGTIYNEADFQRDESLHECTSNKERELENNDLLYGIEENSHDDFHQREGIFITTTKSQAAIMNRKHKFENIEPISSLPLYLFHKSTKEPNQPEESWSNIIKGVADNALINASTLTLLSPRKEECLLDKYLMEIKSPRRIPELNFSKSLEDNSSSSITDVLLTAVEPLLAEIKDLTELPVEEFENDYQNLNERISQLKDLTETDIQELYNHKSKNRGIDLRRRLTTMVPTTSKPSAHTPPEPNRMEDEEDQEILIGSEDLEPFDVFKTSSEKGTPRILPKSKTFMKTPWDKPDDDKLNSILDFKPKKILQNIPENDVLSFDGPKRLMSHSGKSTPVNKWADILKRNNAPQSSTSNNEDKYPPIWDDAAHGQYITDKVSSKFEEVNSLFKKKSPEDSLFKVTHKFEAITKGVEDPKSMLSNPLENVDGAKSKDNLTDAEELMKFLAAGILARGVHGKLLSAIREEPSMNPMRDSKLKREPSGSDIAAPSSRSKGSSRSHKGCSERCCKKFHVIKDVSVEVRKRNYQDRPLDKNYKVMHNKQFVLKDGQMQEVNKVENKERKFDSDRKLSIVKIDGSEVKIPEDFNFHLGKPLVVSIDDTSKTRQLGNQFSYSELSDSIKNLTEKHKLKIQNLPILNIKRDLRHQRMPILSIHPDEKERVNASEQMSNVRLVRVTHKYIPKEKEEPVKESESQLSNAGEHLSENRKFIQIFHNPAAASSNPDVQQNSTDITSKESVGDRDTLPSLPKIPSPRKALVLTDHVSQPINQKKDVFKSPVNQSTKGGKNVPTLKEELSEEEELPRKHIPHHTESHRMKPKKKKHTARNLVYPRYPKGKDRKRFDWDAPSLSRVTLNPSDYVVKISKFSIGERNSKKSLPGSGDDTVKSPPPFKNVVDLIHGKRHTTPISSKLDWHKATKKVPEFNIYGIAKPKEVVKKVPSFIETFYNRSKNKERWDINIESSASSVSSENICGVTKPPSILKLPQPISRDKDETTVKDSVPIAVHFLANSNKPSSSSKESDEFLAGATKNSVKTKKSKDKSFKKSASKDVVQPEQVLYYKEVVLESEENLYNRRNKKVSSSKYMYTQQESKLCTKSVSSRTFIPQMKKHFEDKGTSTATFSDRKEKQQVESVKSTHSIGEKIEKDCQTKLYAMRSFSQQTDNVEMTNKGIMSIPLSEPVSVLYVSPTNVEQKCSTSNELLKRPENGGVPVDTLDNDIDSSHEIPDMNFSDKQLMKKLSAAALQKKNMSTSLNTIATDFRVLESNETLGKWNLTAVEETSSTLSDTEPYSSPGECYSSKYSVVSVSDRSSKSLTLQESTYSEGEVISLGQIKDKLKRL